MEANVCYNSFHRSVWTQSKLLYTGVNAERVSLVLIKQRYSSHHSSTCFCFTTTVWGVMYMYVSMWVFLQTSLFFCFFSLNLNLSILVRMAVKWALRLLCFLPATLRPQAHKAMSRFLWDYWGFELRPLLLLSIGPFLQSWVFKSHFVNHQKQWQFPISSQSKSWFHFGS